MTDFDKNMNKREHASREDEIDLIRVIAVLWLNRRWIMACTLIFTFFGITYTVLTKEVFESKAIIALKDSRPNDGSRMLSQIGGLGATLASQLGAGGVSLEKMRIILKSQELAEDVIEKDDLLPVLYEKQWDSGTNNWKNPDPQEQPSLQQGADRLRKGILGVDLDEKKGVIGVSARTADPEFSRNIVNMYLDALNERIRFNVTSDANNNRVYLEQQLARTSDPVLSEKLRMIIAAEIEKSMFVSSRAFELLEMPQVPREHVKPNRVRLVVLSFMFGLFLGTLTVFGRKLYSDVRISMYAREARP